MNTRPTADFFALISIGCGVAIASNIWVSLAACAFSFVVFDYLRRILEAIKKK